jgi:glucose-1-phosphate adenylyltransferase
MRSRRGSILALVLAGGEGGRLGPLTDDRAKPAMPFAGVYKLIDFPLSNCHHSRVSDVWVIQQYEPHSLSEHLSNGRPWDLDRTFGGLRVVHPATGDAEETGLYQGNADAIYRSCEAIEEFDPEVILVVSADAVYKLDYRDVVEAHHERGAEVTMVTTAVPLGQAGRFGTVKLAKDGRVTDFAYKPDEPDSKVVTTEVFVYDARVLLETLSKLAADDGELADFGDELLPMLVERGKAYAYDLGGYWKDVGTIESYWQAHMDLLEPEPRLDLDDPAWPILTLASQRPPARIEASAKIEGSLISPGCAVRGHVVRSVLGPGVVVEEEAEVVDSVVLADARIAVPVSRAIVDSEVEVERTVSGKDEVSVVGRTA